MLPRAARPLALGALLFAIGCSSPSPTKPVAGTAVVKKPPAAGSGAASATPSPPLEAGPTPLPPAPSGNPFLETPPPPAGAPLAAPFEQGFTGDPAVLPSGPAGANPFLVVPEPSAGTPVPAPFGQAFTADPAVLPAGPGAANPFLAPAGSPTPAPPLGADGLPLDPFGAEAFNRTPAPVSAAPSQAPSATP